MNKIFLKCILFFLSLTFATNTSADTSISWNNNPVSCGTENLGDQGAGPRIAYGVPAYNTTSIAAIGSVTCISHMYYPSVYRRYFTYNGGMTLCDPGDRVSDQNLSEGRMDCMRHDDTPPSLSDITNSNAANMLANDSQGYYLNISDGGRAPISKIEGTLENVSSPSLKDTFIKTSAPWGSVWNISKVDNDRQTNGARNYTFELTRVCDLAKNCWNGTKSYHHDVYSNTIAANVTTRDISVNQLEQSSNIADGSVKQVILSLKDRYGNAIIPASGIGRTVDVNFPSVTNTLFLNQYQRNGGSSVFATRANQSVYSSGLFSSSNSLNSELSTNGQYIYNFKIYTPTSNATLGTVSDNQGQFSINAITVDVNNTTSIASGDNPQNIVVNNSTINAIFNPFFSLAFAGGVKQNGFIEGISQTTMLDFSKNSSVTAFSGLKTFLRYSGGATAKYNLLGSVGSSSPLTLAKDMLTQFSLVMGGNSLGTKLKLLSSPAPKTIDALLSTHISYTLDGYNIVLNSDVIGRESYFGSVSDEKANQSALKIVGLTSNQAKVNEIIDGQKQETNILGKIEKSSLKKEIVKNAYSAVKNIGYKSTDGNTITNEISSSSNAGKKVNNVIYFGGDSGFSDSIFSVGNVGTSLPIKGKNTIVVMGGNLYIKSNLYYENANSILGLIVLKDKSGKGGNIYIDPSVTNISATLFAEKSLISYNGTELDGNSNQSILKNQLHIYGSVFSENTLGGSKKTPFECPAYAKNACLTDEIAQKYDFNYLRRYYLITKSGKQYPANSAKVSGGGTCDTLGVCMGGDTRFKRNIVNTNTDVFAKYPVVIEYNASFQLTPPPLFNIK